MCFFFLPFQQIHPEIFQHINKKSIVIKNQARFSCAESRARYSVILHIMSALKQIAQRREQHKGEDSV